VSERAFKDKETFIRQFKEYIDYCTDKSRFANIAGFCVFADITRGTFYEQKNYYSDTYNKIRNMLEDETLQHNTYMAQLYIKNTFDYADKTKVDSNNVNHNINEEVLTSEERKAKIQYYLDKKKNG